MLPIIDSERVYPALFLILRELHYCQQINNINLIINEKQYAMINQIKKLVK